MGIYNQKELATNLSDTTEPLTGMLFMSTFGLALILLLRKVVNATLLRVYRQEAGKYVLVGMDWTLGRYTIEFEAKNVKLSKRNPVTQNMFGNYSIKDATYVMLPKDFISMEFYNELTLEANSKTSE